MVDFWGVWASEVTVRETWSFHSFGLLGSGLNIT